MTRPPNPIETLRNAEVKKYFLELLRSGSSPEDTYGKLLRFFELEHDLTSRLQLANLAQEDQAAVSRAVASAAADSGMWKPDLIVRQVAEGLRSALHRVGRSQHSDGGWGFKPEESHLWATAWTVMLLHQAAELNLGSDRVAEEKGQEWLIQNRWCWSLDPDDMGARWNSVYEASVAIQALLATARGGELPRIATQSIERSLARLLEEQRPEGDWDTKLSRTPGERDSIDKMDVGATSYTIQALAAAGRQEGEIGQAAARALAWLAGQQNPEGSWNTSYVLPGSLGPQASVGKTCDALRAFLAGERLGVDPWQFQQILDNGVEWLVGKEEAKLNANGRIVGWVWQSEPEMQEADLDFLENTCLTLETLCEFKSVPLPHLAANALWLLRKQHCNAESPDDGKWPNNDTGRIAFALLNFYSRIQESPFFQVAPATPALTPQEAVG
jgi:hypothetical protein